MREVPPETPLLRGRQGQSSLRLLAPSSARAPAKVLAMTQLLLMGNGVTVPASCSYDARQVAGEEDSRRLLSGEQKREEILLPRHQPCASLPAFPGTAGA